MCTVIFTSGGGAGGGSGSGAYNGVAQSSRSWSVKPGGIFKKISTAACFDSLTDGSEYGLATQK